MSTISLTPISSGRLVDEYFTESRNRLLELAAFFDRLDRSSGNAVADFRIAALRDAVQLLMQDGPGRVEKMLLLLSDPTEEPLEHLDRKGALGAYRGQGTA